VIQVTALKDRPTAVALVQRLAGKGYPAFLETPAVGTYRVRVGRYKDRREAEQVSRRLEKEEPFRSFRSVISR
jgi:cell division septation protein DedD